MGLDTTHNCFHGSYSWFGLWREEIAKILSVDLLNMEGYSEKAQIKWSSLPPDPIIHTLLNHPDNEGVITAKDCLPLAERLTEILFLIGDNFIDTTKKFIAGLHLAASRNESVKFH